MLLYILIIQTIILSNCLINNTADFSVYSTWRGCFVPTLTLSF